EPVSRQEGLDRAGSVQPEVRPPELLARRHDCPGGSVGEDDGCPDRTAPGRTEERGPVLVGRANRVEEEDLDFALGPLEASEEPRRQYPRVVHNEAVPSPKNAREVLHPGVPEPA